MSTTSGFGTGRTVLLRRNARLSRTLLALGTAGVLSVTAPAANAEPSPSASVAPTPGAVSTPAPLETVAGAPQVGQLGASAAWCWFSDPRSVHIARRHTRTYTGWIDTKGQIVVSAYDHTTRLVQTAVLMVRFQLDDHNNPSLLAHPDGRLSVFWSAHNGRDIYVRTMGVAEDIRSFGPVRTVQAKVPGDSVLTYTNPVLLPEEDGRIYLFWRSGYTHQGYSTSDDGGRTWKAAKVFIQSARTARPYVKYAGDADSIAVAFTRSHPDEAATGIYYARYRNGALLSADGRRIGSLASPLYPEDADLVYDQKATGVDAWVHDVALGKDGHPVIVYATLHSPRDHRYHWARYDGTRWVNHELTPAGGTIHGDPTKQPSYSGGITLDHDDPSVVYLSREVAGVHEIERWTTPDAGSSWIAESVTTDSTVPNVRPVSPRNLPSNAQLQSIWMTGVYPHFTTFRTSLDGSAPVVPGRPFDTTLRLHVTPTSVPSGAHVQVSARLVREGTGLGQGGQEVVLLQRAAGLSTWTRVIERRTDSNGLVTFRPQITRNTQYAVEWPGNDLRGASLSPVGTVTATRTPTRIRTSASATTVARGASVLLASRLVRAADGMPIGGKTMTLLQRRAGTSSWSTVGSRRAGSDGVSRFVATPTVTTEYAMRWAGDATSGASASAPITVHVR